MQRGDGGVGDDVQRNAAYDNVPRVFLVASVQRWGWGRLMTSTADDDDDNGDDSGVHR